MGFSFEIQFWPIQFWPELSIRMVIRDNAYNTTMTLSNNLNPALQSTASAERPARQVARSPWIIETLINCFPELELKTAELDRQRRIGHRRLQDLPTPGRYMSA